MIKPALKVNWDAYLFLQKKHREIRCKEWGLEYKPYTEHQIENLKREFNKFANNEGLKEIWDDSFCFTYIEMKKLLDSNNYSYKETTIECIHL